MDSRQTSPNLDVLENLLLREFDRRKSENPAEWFPWHASQEWVLSHAFEQARKDVDIVLACGGNRGGKSALAKGIYSKVMRRETPLAHKLRTVDPLTGRVRNKNTRDPLLIWIVPPTLAKGRQDWVNPSDGYSLRYWLGELYVTHKSNPENIYYSRPPGMSEEEAKSHLDAKNMGVFDRTILKSHDQDLLSFESSAVDLVIIDEEIMDEAKFNSILMRVGTPNGTVVMAYTPLHGFSWSYKRYWKPDIEMGRAREIGDRQWIKDSGDGRCVVAVQFGAADNPLAADHAKKTAADMGMSEAEKAARLFGKYGYVEGALIKQLSGLDVESPMKDQAVYVVDHLPGQSDGKGGKVPGRIQQWLVVADPNKSWGAILAALDGNGNMFFVREHLEHSWPDRMHANAIKKMESDYVTGPVRRVADPGSAGAHVIINLADYGLMFETMEKGAGSVASSIKQLRSMAHIDDRHAHPITGALGAPRVYFYRPGLVETRIEDGIAIRTSRLAEQISQARQTDDENALPDTPHKSIKNKLDLFDVARYAAALASPFSVGVEVPEARKMERDHRMPDIDKTMGENRVRDPLEEQFYLPNYNL